MALNLSPTEIQCQEYISPETSPASSSCPTPSQPNLLCIEPSLVFSNGIGYAFLIEDVHNENPQERKPAPNPKTDKRYQADPL